MRRLCFLIMLLFAWPASAIEMGCSATARSLFLACRYDNNDDLLTATAACIDDPADSLAECLIEPSEEHSESEEECTDVLEARLALCDILEDAPHEPEFGEDFADQFVDPAEIGSSVTPSPWFPLVEGNTWTYEATFEEDGEVITEIITVTVTDEIKLIDGVPCRVVNDIVTIDGAVLEDTDDWFAQDVSGNVWYCGEISLNYEIEDGVAELEDLDGSWKSGRDDAIAGMLLPLEPVVGEFIRQEIAWTDAEDVIEIDSITGDESAPVASCDSACLVTRDFTPLEPEVNEFKYYAPGIGLIVELVPDEDERVELIDFTVQ